MNTTTVRFSGAHGHDLSARLGSPLDTPPRACALFAHCFTCSKDLRAVVTLSEALVAERIAVLRFDFTGLGQSEGDFSRTTFSSNVGDLHAAAAWLAETHEAPSILIGHSLGGSAVLHAAAGIPSVRAVATVGAPFDPSHVTGLFSRHLDDIARDGEAEVVLAGRRFTLRDTFVRDLEGQEMTRVVAGLGVPLLIFHSPVDRTVGIDNAASLYDAARHPKSFVSLDDADHLLTAERDARYVGTVLAAWASRYVEPV